MIKWLKKIFGKEEEKRETDPPGRTFKRILTGEYFGLKDVDASDASVMTAKKDKIQKIKELELSPKFLRYALKKSLKQEAEPVITAAHVVFQKEIFDEKWNMVHVTEVSFIVPKEEFSEFENMSGVSLKDDFRDLTEYNGEKIYQGKERRKTERPSVF